MKAREMSVEDLAESNRLLRIALNDQIERTSQAEARVKELEAQVQTFRDGENYIKQFEDAKQRCAVMYNPDEVFSRYRLESWAEENGFIATADKERDVQGEHVNELGTPSKFAVLMDDPEFREAFLHEYESERVKELEAQVKRLSEGSDDKVR